MIFSEMYSVYYNTVAKILTEAVQGVLDEERLTNIINKNAFSESVLQILPSLKNGNWQLLTPGLSTPITHTPTMPLTLLQKRWLKAVLLDKRVRLFDLNIKGLENVEPLFTEDDYIVFDKYLDGDDYEDERYINCFKIIVNAIRTNKPLSIVALNRQDRTVKKNVRPHNLEYSAKDDKFRLITGSDTYGGIINLGRIISCKEYNGGRIYEKPKRNTSKSVTLIITNHRNTLNRVMMHFAHFKKTAERIDDLHYKVTIDYDTQDENELVIRVLSFGPFVKAEEPQAFVKLIKERLIKQYTLEKAEE